MVIVVISRNEIYYNIYEEQRVDKIIEEGHAISVGLRESQKYGSHYTG
jgi:hypothetical protein